MAQSESHTRALVIGGRGAREHAIVAGARVLGVTALGRDAAAARAAAYAAADMIHFDLKQVRRDLALRALR